MTPSTESSLPIDPLERPFLEALSRGPVVLTSPTGSGKSTRVPLWCGRAGYRTLVIEPRRVACRALYRFLDAQADVPVGYAVRHERAGPPDPTILFVTPGVALRMLPAGDLEEFGAVILDEFHERGMDTDLILALLKERREKWSIVVMSATIDVNRLAGWLGASCMEGDARTFPVKVRYQGGPHIPSSRGLTERVSAGVARALTEIEQGDVLVFLPGKGEIGRCRKELLAPRRAIGVIELHGGLSSQKQDLAFSRSAGRRVILSTNVAESSVTLPWVRSVVDSGLEKRTTYRNGRSVLSLMPISNDSAKQRAGRAGRLGPGLAIRLWDSKGVLRDSTPPEILREDLDPLLLTVGALGRDIRSLDFLDPPNPKAVDAAETRLSDMGLLTARGLTSIGREAFKLPVDPLLARLLLEAKESGGSDLLEDGVDLVASLSVYGPLFAGRPGQKRKKSGTRRRGARAGRVEAEPYHHAGPLASLAEELDEIKCDGVARIQAVRGIGPASKVAHSGRLAEARKISRQLRAMLGLPAKSRRSKILQRELARAAVRSSPSCAFIKRDRKYGGPGMELTLAEESFASPDSEALAVLDTHSVRTKGFRTTHLATCALPLSRRDLAISSIGRCELESARIEDGRLFGIQVTRYGGVELDRREIELVGADAARGAALLIEGGEVFVGLFSEVRERLQETELYFRSSGEELPAEIPSLDARDWLEARFQELGLTRAEDLELLSPDDLIPRHVPPEELADFRSRFPLEISLRDRTLRAEYDFSSRRVCLVHVSGRTAPPPSTMQLPSWPGWEVKYRVHSRTWKLS